MWVLTFQKEKMSKLISFLRIYYLLLMMMMMMGKKKIRMQIKLKPKKIFLIIKIQMIIVKIL